MGRRRRPPNKPLALTARDMISKSASALMLLLCGCVLAAGQTRPDESPGEVWELGPAQCQYNTVMLDVLAQGTAPGALITVVARLGDGETRPGLNRRRLHNVRVYWAEYLTDIRRGPETILLNEGERAAGDGRLEFYVGGELKGVLKVKRDADLSVGTCYTPDDGYIRNMVYDRCRVKEDRNFYPCRERGRARQAGRARRSP
jgi:hypothetical protein